MRADVARKLYPDYKQHLQSAFSPPRLGSKQPIEKVFQLSTEHFSHCELVLGLGLVNRSWYIYMYHNLFLLAGTAETASHDPVFVHRWKVATERGSDRSLRVPARHLLVSGYGPKIDGVAAPSVTTIEFKSAETNFRSALHSEFVEKEFALLRRHPLAKTFICKAKYTNCTPMASREGCDWISKNVETLVVKMLYGGDFAHGHIESAFPLPMKRWPRKIIIETAVPERSYWLYIERLFKDMEEKIIKGECTGLVYFELVVLCNTEQNNIIDHVKGMKNIPQGFSIRTKNLYHSESN